ncbi:MAG: hypothetical protein K8S99_11055 [Planctomycetes bacterium]|nr:hypothetical protein [Planctomycetota bacterium]
MKNEAVYARKLAALLKKVRRGHTDEPAPARDPVTQLVVAFLEWNAPRKSAREAHNRLMAVMVDNNDLRVSHGHELVALMGENYPRAEERAARLREALQEVFVREHGVMLDSLTDKAKRQVRTYLDTLPGTPQFVAAQVFLLSFGGHAIPIDDRMADLLRQEGAADPEADVAAIAEYVERHVKPAEAVETHLAMQTWADSASRKSSKAPAKPRAAAKPKKKPSKK